jgi:hypothetical protein
MHCQLVMMKTRTKLQQQQLIVVVAVLAQLAGH